MNQNKTQCPVCGSNKISKTTSTQDYFLTNEKFDILTCSDCSYSMTFPIPRPSDLPKYYQSENYLSHTASKKGAINSLYQVLRNINLKRKYKLVSKYKTEGQILDIGCGTGELLNYFSNRNWKVQGIEPNSEARNFAIKQYKLEIFSEEELPKLPKEQFDIITMWHVLEHVPDFNLRIDEIKKLLKPHGTIFIAVPNINSPDAKYYGKYWAALDVPRHLHHFSPKSIKQVAKKNKLNLIEMVPMKMDAYYVSLLSEKYLKKDFSFLRAFYQGLRSNLMASKSNNYSSMIFVFKNSME